MVGDLGHRVQGVERGCDHDADGAGGDGAVGLLDDPGRGLFHAAHEHRHPAVGAGGDGGDHGLALVIGEVGHLTGGAEDEEAVHATVDEVVDDAVEGGEVDVALSGEGGDHGGVDADEFLGHADGSWSRDGTADSSLAV